MGKHNLIVFTEPTDGQEAEYNEWYNTVHLSDVLAVPGMVAAQRFKLAAQVVGDMPTRYVSIYEIDAEDPQVVIDDIYRLAGTEAMVLSPALDDTRQAVALFSPCSERLNG